jgi:hypothetical protein
MDTETFAVLGDTLAKPKQGGSKFAAPHQWVSQNDSQYWRSPRDGGVNRWTAGGSTKFKAVGRQAGG